MQTIQTNVLVCGGGCAGIAAALSSARNGAQTLLIERAGFSGGIITTVGLPYFDGLIDKPFTGSGFQPKPYDISYRTLVPQKVSNLLVAGRCHSASRTLSHQSSATQGFSPRSTRATPVRHSGAMER